MPAAVAAGLRQKEKTMNNALGTPAAGQFSQEAEGALGERQEVRRAGLLVVLAAIAIAMSLWLASSVGIPRVAAAGDDAAMPEVPYFPSQYLNQATEPTPMPPTF